MSHPQYVMVEIGYYCKIAVPRHMVPTLTEIFLSCRKLSDNGSTSEELAYEVKPANAELDIPLSPREEGLKKEIAERQQSWYEQYSKRQELEKTVKKLQADQSEFEQSPEYVSYLARRVEELNKQREEEE